VGTDGTIDWYCPARFDAPSLFAALPDSERGGCFRFSGRPAARPKQLYLADTNILLTRFLAADAVGEVIDGAVRCSPLRGDRARRPRRREGHIQPVLVLVCRRAHDSRPAPRGEARLVFEKMLTCANHVGLYAEEIGPSGEALGNFPQAFTHLALISSAVNLDVALDKAGSG